MTFFSRTLCLILICTIASGTAYPVLADDVSPATTTPADTTVAPSSDAGSTSDTSSTAGSTSDTTTTSSNSNETSATSTQADVTDTQTTTDTTASSTQSDTTTHEEVSGGTGTTTTQTASSTPDLTDTMPPVLVPPEGTSTPIDTVATSTGTAVGTTTLPSATTTPTASSTVISTGDATAGANVVNVAGSNFVNSSGDVVLGNYFGTSSGIDLRTATSAFSSGVVCLIFACTGSEGVTVNLTGTSSLENLLALNATTGGNMIASPGGDASIFTGNAYVGLNLVNLANLNVIDSAYLIAALNLFHGLDGDLVFPGLAGFFDALTQGAAPSSVTLDSNTTVDNQIGFTTDTGNNTSDATSSAIVTGSGTSLGTILNQLNNTLIGGANLAILLRITGTWNGQIFGAPDGLSILHGDDGSIYITKAGGTAADIASSTVNATTSALITNHANLGALTGGNGIFGADSAQIVTGNALAGANVLTLANQNIIGRNWMTAVINIFGDWNGNLDFGRPDLWVGERVEAPAAITDGSDIILHFTVANHGDAPAHAASLALALDTAHLTVHDPVTVALGTLAPAATQEIVVHATVHDVAAGTTIDTGGTVSETETDNNVTDNTDHIAITAGNLGGGGGSVRDGLVYPKKAAVAPTASITVTRTTAHELASGTAPIHEELVIKNTSDASSSPYDVHDLVKGSDGVVIEDQAWPVGVIAPHEEVTVSYDVTFAADAPAGVYLLSTVLAQDQLGDSEFKNNGSIIRIASLVSSPVSSGTHHAAAAPLASTSLPVVTREVATTTPLHSFSNPLLAAALSAPIPWPYAFGFAGSAGLLSVFLWGVATMRRRLP